MKVLVTGATGLLGSHVLEQGLVRGHEIVAIARSISERSFLSRAKDRITVVSVDLANVEFPETILNDVHAVIHCAALASADPNDASKMEFLNYEVPKKLFAMAKKANVPIWVQISTTAVLTGMSGRVSAEKRFWATANYEIRRDKV